MLISEDELYLRILKLTTKDKEFKTLMIERNYDFSTLSRENKDKYSPKLGIAILYANEIFGEKENKNAQI